jgi:hypothetical protein
MERESKMDRYWLALIIGGGALAAASMRRPSKARPWAVAVGLACATAGFLCHSGSGRASAALSQLWRSASEDDAIDAASEDSFPASDAPARSTRASATPA